MQSGERTSATVTVLCVENDVQNTEYLLASIRQRYPEIKVICAADGAEGLQLFQEHRPEIIITDITMPVLDGIQMSAQIRRIDPTAAIIALTALSDSSHLLKAIAVGIDTYLQKPVNLAALLDAIGRHVERILLGRAVGVQNNRIRMLSRAVEQSPSSVLITDAGGVIEYVNPKFCEVSGYTPEEVTGQNPRILKSGLTARETYATLWRTISSGGIWQGELQNRKKNGETYWISTVVSPIRDDDGTVHYLSVREIITDRKLAEQEHETTLEFLHIVNGCRGIDDIIPAAARFFKQHSHCKAAGIRLRDGEDYPYVLAQGFPVGFVKQESALCARSADGEVARDGSGSPVIGGMCGTVICGRTDPRLPFFTDQGSFWTNSSVEAPEAGPGGDRFNCARHGCSAAGFESMALIPLSVGTERLGLLQLNDRRRGVFTRQEIDQWERLAGYLSIALLKFRAEESLEQLTEELEQRVAERTRSLKSALKEQESFSYSVSHDLRAPLRHINSYLSILSEEFGDLLPGEALSLVERSRAASRHMGALIDDLLELSKVSRTSLSQEVVNLSELATQTCNLLQESEPGRCVEFVITKGLAARGDKSLLRQMMVNLLGNAWKYTSAVAQARVEFGRMVTDDQEVFFVRDNGVGFDMAYSDKLFGEFQRLHGPEYEGTGIGLATVKRIVDRHHGKVWAEAKPGEGATFYFVLP